MRKAQDEDNKTFGLRIQRSRRRRSKQVVKWRKKNKRLNKIKSCVAGNQTLSLIYDPLFPWHFRVCSLAVHYFSVSSLFIFLFNFAVFIPFSLIADFGAKNSLSLLLSHSFHSLLLLQPLFSELYVCSQFRCDRCHWPLHFSLSPLPFSLFSITFHSIPVWNWPLEMFTTSYCPERMLFVPQYIIWNKFVAKLCSFAHSFLAANL